MLTIWQEQWAEFLIVEYQCSTLVIINWAENHLGQYENKGNWLLCDMRLGLVQLKFLLPWYMTQYICWSWWSKGLLLNFVITIIITAYYLPAWLKYYYTDSVLSILYTLQIKVHRKLLQEISSASHLLIISDICW